MKQLGRDLGRVVALWVALAASQMIFGAILFLGAPAFADSGPMGAGEALLVVSLVDAVILTLLAQRMRLRGRMLGLVLGGVLFGVQTGQALIEAVIFNNDLHMATATLIKTGIAALLRDAVGALLIARMWPGSSEPGWHVRGLAWKTPVTAFFYVFCYFAAGSLIAWQSPAVRAFYAHVGEINVGSLVLLQVVRGVIWCGLAWLLVRDLAAPAWKAGLLVGLAFAGFMIPELLLPNPIMPWPVRSVHMVEVGVSNFLFGAITALLLQLGARTAELAPKR